MILDTINRIYNAGNFFVVPAVNIRENMKRNVMRIKVYPFVSIVVMIFLASCGKPNDYSNIYNTEVVKEWKLQLLSVNENHPTPQIADSSILYFQLNSDNSLRFDVFIDSFQYRGDAITAVQLNLGDPVTDGPLIMNFPARISPGGVTGIIYNLRQGLIDTLNNDNIEKYINILTTKAPTGLVRGQLTPQILYAANVNLTGSEVVPTVNTNTTGTAYIRVGANNILYSKVIINNDVPADPITSAALYQAVAGSNGPLIRTLVSSQAGFGTATKTTLTPSETNNLLSTNSYLVGSSAAFPNGKIRGQFKK
ncbi:MAG: hypothetical protein JWQ40_763 [Segetibacter sp.]|nr:hypothetical protein [Segetibacter sp.]